MDYCKKHQIAIEAYSPLGNGGILNHPEIVDMAKRYQTTPANICLSYLIQKDIIVIPRSHIKKEIKENFHSKLTIELEDMRILKSLIIDA